MKSTIEYDRGEGLSYASRDKKDAASPDKNAVPGIDLAGDLYKSVVDHAHDAIYVLQNERFSFVNPRFCELLGYSYEKLTSPHFDPYSILSDFSRVMTKRYIEARIAGDRNPFRYEIEMIRADGGLVQGDLTTVVVPNQPGITVLGIIRDLTERKQFEQKSEIRVKKLQDAIEAVADGVWDWDLTSNQVWINPATRQLFGLPPDQEMVEAEQLLACLHPEDQLSIRKQLTDLIQGRIRFYSSELRILQEFGVVRWVLGRGKIVDYGEDGAPLRIVGTNVNITEQKEAQLLLRESEEKFMRIFENAPLLMAISSMEDGRFIEINSVFARVFGYKRHEIIGHSVQELGIISEEARAKTYDVLERDGVIRDLEMSYRRADGSPLHCRYYAHKVEINGEHCLLSIATDITQSRIEERNDRATYQLLKLISEETDLKPMLEKVIPLLKEWSGCEAVGIRIRDGEEYPFYASEGYPEEFLKKDSRLCIQNENGDIRRNEEGAPVYACICGEVIQRKLELAGDYFTPFGSFWSSDLSKIQPTLQRELELEGLRGRCLDLGFNCAAIVPLKTSRGILGLLHFQDRDASKINAEKVKFLENFSLHLALSVAQKLDAIALMESETYYRHLVEDATDSIFLMNIDGVILDVNEAACQSLGYSRDELLAKSIDDVDPLYPADNFREFWSSRELNKELMFETEHRRKDGTTFPVEVNAKVFSLNGELFFVGAARDISERKRHEEERNRLQQAIAQTGETIVVTDPSGIITYVNPAFEKITGYTAEEVIGRNPRVLQSGEHSNEFYEELWDTISSGNTWKGRFVNRHKDGNHYVEDAVISPVMNDAGEIVNYIAIRRDITKQQEAASELAHSRDLMQYVIEHTRSAVAVHDRDLNYIYVSQRYLDEYNVKEKDVIGRHHYDVFPDLPQKWRDVHQRALRGEVSSAEDDPYYRDDGSVEWTRWECRPWYEADGTIGGIIVYTEVITEAREAKEEQKKLTQQLYQAQKMESVGRLAGGIAHDFNNLLGVILGYAELGIELVDKGHPSHNILQDIFKAAKKSSALTKQLLTFARKQTVNQQNLNLNVAIEGTLRMLSRLVGEEIDLSLDLSPELGQVRIDPTQVDQILANMAINSRDAIDGVGTISISTSNITIDDAFAAQHPESQVGDYVLLSISDDGSGMDEETVSQIFEPFYTTKRAGEGTGLGLSTVYGIIHQNGGFITCYSEEGVGTTFKLYLPRQSDVGQIREESSKPTSAVQEGTETVLIVEDEVSMLNLTSRILKKLGYHVLMASTPHQAIELAEQHAGRIDLLMTDVIMPEMNGRDLSRKLEEKYPGMKSLFMSGYTADIIARHGVLEEGIYFLPKPFSVKEIAAKVRDVFDKGA